MDYMHSLFISCVLVSLFPGQIPVVPLNFSVLSSEMNLDRDTVECCVKEMLQALSRSVQFKRNVEFIFNGIGKLTIRDFKVKMKFQKDFLQGIDQSGNLVNALKNVRTFSFSPCFEFFSQDPINK